MIRAVVDTSVLISGLLSPSGNEALILLALHQRLVMPCFSEAMIDEYKLVLARAKFSFGTDTIAALLTMLRENGECFARLFLPPCRPTRPTQNLFSALWRQKPISLSRGIGAIFQIRPTETRRW